MSETGTPSTQTPSPVSTLLDTFQIVAILAVALLFFVGLYLRAESVSPALHHDYSMRLLQLREADATVNAEVLANQVAVSRNYDMLNAQIAVSRQRVAQLAQVPGYLPDAERAAMRRAVADLDRTLAEKHAGVDAFRRSNSVLKNSLTYFSSTAEAFLAARREGAVKRSVEAYVRQVLYFARTPGEDRRAPVEAAEARMRVAAEHSVARPVVENLALHGQIVLKHATEVDVLVHAIMSLDSGTRLNTLGQRYLSAHDEATSVAGRYRLLAYLLGIVMALYLALTFYRLERTRHSLSQANAELTQRYAALARAEERLRLHDAAFENAHEGMTLTDLEGTIIDVNPAFTRITGYERSEVIGRNPRVLKSGRHDQAFYEAMWKSIRETGNWRGEIWNRGKFGDIYPEILSISAVRDSGGAVRHYVAVFADISRLKEQERQLAEMAYHDVLTGLPNRALLADRVSQALPLALRSKSMLAVCYLDLDGFKPVNDTWGHDIGDLVLVEQADRFKRCLRAGDTVARLGGDEFVLLLVGLDDRAECEQTLQRVLKAIAEPMHFAPEPIVLSASLGVALYPEDAGDPETLMRHADQAMYRAKQTGKNRFHVYDPSLDSQSRAQEDHAAQIRAALARGEFVLHYQPRVDMRSGSVLGAEALLRWHDPERGMLLPERFLPRIASDPVGVEVGNWVLDAALADLAIWRGAGLDIDVSINISGHHLHSSGFVQDLSEALARHPEAQGRLFLEVMETTALEDVGAVARVIEECARLEVGLALDGFGTGYSSLTYLKRLPARRIKIDRTFVSEILNDPNNLIMVQGVLGLARAFQREIVAVGVESVEQGRLLLQIDCDQAQGFGIARPMPADELLAWSRQWRPDPAWSAVAGLAWDDTLRALLIAEVHHRNWIAQLLYSVKEFGMVPHRNVADSHHCQFGHWYYSACAGRCRERSSFREIEVLHDGIHGIAGEIDELLRDGRIPDARARLPELIERHESLLDILRQLQTQMARPRA